MKDQAQANEREAEEKVKMAKEKAFKALEEQSIASETKL